VIRRRTTGEAAKREHVFSKEMPIMVKVKNNNFCDSLGKMSLRYAVLSKENRIQILVNPTPRQLRKRGKRQWQLVQAIDGEADARWTEASTRTAMPRADQAVMCVDRRGGSRPLRAIVALMYLN
jgi:hypothetical protein